MRKSIILFFTLSFLTAIDCSTSIAASLPRSNSSIQIDGDKRPLVRRRAKRQFKKAIELFYDHEYDKSLTIFRKLLKKDPDRPSLNFFVGMNIWNLNKSKTESRPFFEKASKSTVANYLDQYEESKSPVFANYYLAQVYLSLNKFDEAINNALVFRTQIPATNIKLIDEVTAFVRSCYVAKALSTNPQTDVTIKPLDALQTTYSDFGAQFSSDGNTLYFTSKRKFSEDGTKEIDGQYKSDIYYINKENGKWSNPIRLKTACLDDANDNFCSISADGNYLFFSSDREKEQYDIYYCLRTVDNKWTTPRKLSENVNSPLSNETFAYLSQDWKTLFVVSDREGGWGGRDIYTAKNKENGDWLPLVNMGPRINSARDEKSPWVSANGKEIYFSSKGHNTSGGFDIFYSKFNNDSTWTEPINIGYPVNTPYDDHYFVFSPDKSYALYSSAKKGLDGSQDVFEVKGFTLDKALQTEKVIAAIEYDANLKPNHKYLIAKDNKIKYTVQVGAGKEVEMSPFNVLYGIRVCTGKDGMKRLIIGEFENKEDAIILRDEIMKLGFIDAWVPVIDENRYDCE